MSKVNWKIIASGGIILLLVVFIGVSLLGGWGSGYWGMMGPGMMGGWGYNPFGWVGMFLMFLIPVGFLILVILGIIALLRGFTSDGPGGSTSHNRSESQLTAREVLQLRYARGEISREEYQQMLRDIS
jgi:putative membrane protein